MRKWVIQCEEEVEGEEETKYEGWGKRKMKNSKERKEEEGRYNVKGGKEGGG